MKQYFVYILASKPCGTLYIGVTNDIYKRTYQHQSGSYESFTKKYAVHRLVYFEQTESIETAILCEKQMKKWNRAWKIRLIEKENPYWQDLSITTLGMDSRLRGNDKLQAAVKAETSSA